jgi:hypothetical protein
MKKKNRTTKSFSFSAPKALALEIERAARDQGRSRSSLLVWLLKRQKTLDEN